MFGERSVVGELDGIDMLVDAETVRVRLARTVVQRPLLVVVSVQQNTQVRMPLFAPSADVANLIIGKRNMGTSVRNQVTTKNLRIPSIQRSYSS